MTTERRPNVEHGPAGDAVDEQDTADASSMTEGVGGMADVPAEQRATVSDVDGENVPEEDQPTPA